MICVQTRDNNILDLVIVKKLILSTHEKQVSHWQIAITNLQTKAKEDPLLIPNDSEPNCTAIRNEVQSVDWNQLLNAPSIDDIYSKFLSPGIEYLQTNSAQTTDKTPLAIMDN